MKAVSIMKTPMRLGVSKSASIHIIVASLMIVRVFRYPVWRPTLVIKIGPVLGEIEMFTFKSTAPVTWYLVLMNLTHTH